MCNHVRFLRGLSLSQKKISELPLLATIVDALDFVGDNGVQTYKFPASSIYTYLKSKIFGQTAETAPAVADTLSIYDASDSDFKKMTLENFLKVIAVLTAETAPATGDNILLYDASASAVRKMTLENVLTLLNSLTAETAPATDDSLLLYDTSASAVRKMTFENWLKVINSLTEDASPDLASDFLLSYDTSASAVKKVKPSNLSGIFTKSFTSSQQTLASSSTVTVAHGFGSIPTLVQLRVECTSADNQFSVGDTQIINFNDVGSSGTDGVASLFMDATNISYIMTNIFDIVTSNKTSRTAVILDKTKWKLVIKAWA